MRAYTKDIFRNISHSKKRFLAIALITLLGVMMFSGLQASCNDLEKSADAFFDAQHLHDIQIQSTLGLTDDDITALLQDKDVAAAAGIRSVSADIKSSDSKTETLLSDAAVTTLNDAGIDAPYLLKGSLPSAADEALLTEKTAKDGGLSIGDSFTISATEDTDSSSSSPALSVTKFKVCGIVTDPTDVDNPFGQVSYCSSQSSSDRVFVKPDAVSGSIYTSVVIELKDAKSYNCYSDDYTDYVNDVQTRIEDNIRPSAEERRTEEVRADAQKTLDDEISASEDALKKQTEEAEKSLSAAGSQAVPKEQLQAQKAQLEQKLKAAQDKIDEEKAAQQKKIDKMEGASWYVMNRTALSGWSNIQSDADSIASIGVVFPVVFFAIAILISLTTVARMIDEDRGLLGTYKSLGFTNQEIQRKYLLYVGMAGLAGSIGGTILAFIAFPSFLFTVFRMMYLLPSYSLSVMPLRAVLGPVLFMGGILLTTVYSCNKELRQSAAALMRPKSPKPGSHVLLERIRPVWRRMSFLRKVTARNLFRYKSRMLMTVLGIGGCMALLIFGFALRDSDVISRYTNAAITSAKLQTSDGEISVSLVVFPDETDASEYVNFDKLEASNAGSIVSADSGTDSTASAGTSISSADSGTDSTASAGTRADTGNLETGDIYVTQNAATLLNFSAGDKVSCRLPDLSEADLPVTAVVRNYIGNYMYMNESTYKSYFGDPGYNAVLASFKDSVSTSAKKAFGTDLKNMSGISAVMVTSELMEQSADTFRLMNVVVAIIIVMSAALAFVVLFTLQTTNISERERELATIKVLGFYDREVHQYINRETWFLTILGVLIGLPLGWLFAQTISVILRLPSISLSVSIHPVSYLYSAVLTLLFALLVQLITNITLNRIDPATALKSVE
ncbi:MAG: FtsX-like permease family protein [Lachnospiraceae bacterium]|nr:FtsX-like permease family protein [Lachnospiraceae bacterium]MCI1334365.1 FtsX-like permease family protein [Lachnospiraceae bacterium]MCI1358545.1 FtsX-like permease family protein [Lachnospiraceae bacterium]MCI1378783.1 FtsX-like permease family protein [Lachnospiraceae bacterium]MCI1455338.1 FtsX-like permease family protein [Lachnospiraceae bacterium]